MSNTVIKERSLKHKYQNFWDWFISEKDALFGEIKTRENLEENFFNKIIPELKKVHEGLSFLAGMPNDSTAELIITPDGIIKNIPFAEELVQAAPDVPNWKFTALKPESGSTYNITINDYDFGEEQLHFYANHYPKFPDEVAITITYKGMNEENAQTIKTGVFLYLDNFLGELRSITNLDYVNIIDESEATEKLVPMSKLKSFLIWREKEFIEQYTQIRYRYSSEEEYKYASYQGELSNGLPMFAMMNASLLNWEYKVSHPWMLTFQISFETIKNEHGLPDKETLDLMNSIEDQLDELLTKQDGFLNIGRQTLDGRRDIYIASVDFRIASKAAFDLMEQYKDSNLAITYGIHRDKYWRTLNAFMEN